jgi:two-component system, OmpR family, phosphate regulon response regulator PhoB
MNELPAVNTREVCIDRPPRILVVEDEAPLGELLVYNLTAEGFEVEHVDRGDEAELRLAETPFDLVILDWLLSGVSGLEI